MLPRCLLAHSRPRWGWFSYVLPSLVLFPLHISPSQIYQPRYMHAPQAPGQLPHISAAYPSTQMFVPLPQTLPIGPVSHTVPMAYYPVGALYPPGSTVLVDGGFDAGARFGPSGSATLPVSSDPEYLSHLRTGCVTYCLICDGGFASQGIETSEADGI